MGLVGFAVGVSPLSRCAGVNTDFRHPELQPKESDGSVWSSTLKEQRQQKVVQSPVSAVQDARLAGGCAFLGLFRGSPPQQYLWRILHEAGRPKPQSQNPTTLSAPTGIVSDSGVTMPAVRR